MALTVCLVAANWSRAAGLLLGGGRQPLALGPLGDDPLLVADGGEDLGLDPRSSALRTLSSTSVADRTTFWARRRVFRAASGCPAAT